jgi:hypothetical protein
MPKISLRRKLPARPLNDVSIATIDGVIRSLFSGKEVEGYAVDSRRRSGHWRLLDLSTRRQAPTAS